MACSLVTSVLSTLPKGSASVALSKCVLTVGFAYVA